jgi:ligand-binding sensor domain-containing protein
MKKIIFTVAVLLVFLITNTARSQTFTNYTTLDGLPDDFICGGVAIDEHNNKWFGTAAGVAKFDDVTWTVYDTSGANHIIDNYITCIAVDTADNIWVGTNLGVSKFDGTTWTSYTISDGLVDNGVKYIYAESSGSVWFATGLGLSKFDGSSWTSYTTSQGLLSSDIMYITGDGVGNKWIGTQLGGYSKYNNATFTNYTIATIDSLASDNIFAIAVDAANTQWIGTWSGLSKIDAAGNWITTYRIGSGIYNSFVRDIKIDADGELWIANFADYNGDGGISRFNGTTWTTYSVGQGLVNMQVIRLAIDQESNVWIATGLGVSKLSGVSGIPEMSKSVSVQVSPNPVIDCINISSGEQADVIRLMNLQGQTIEEIIPSSSQLSIQTPELSAGMYLLQFVFGDQVQCSKIIVQ